MDTYREYQKSKRPERTAKRRPGVFFVPGQLAVRVAVTDVGFLQDSLNAWGRNYKQEVPADALAVDSQEVGGATMSLGAFIHEEKLVEEALRYRYNVSQDGDRARASRLLAQFAVASRDHQEYLTRLNTHYDLSLELPEAELSRSSL